MPRSAGQAKKLGQQRYREIPLEKHAVEAPLSGSLSDHLTPEQPLQQQKRLLM